jgi:hypothetical protein
MLNRGAIGISVSMSLTTKNPEESRLKPLVKLKAALKNIEESRGSTYANGSQQTSLRVNSEGICQADQITLCYSASIGDQKETLMNHFPLNERSKKQFETELENADGTHLWLTIECTPNK